MPRVNVFEYIGLTKRERKFETRGRSYLPGRGRLAAEGGLETSAPPPERESRFRDHGSIGGGAAEVAESGLETQLLLPKERGGSRPTTGGSLPGRYQGEGGWSRRSRLFLYKREHFRDHGSLLPGP